MCSTSMRRSPTSARPRCDFSSVTEFYRAYRHQDDHCRRAARRDRGHHAADRRLSSVMGMNVIVNDSTRWIPLIILCLIMLTISLVLLRWTPQLAGGEHPLIGWCDRVITQGMRFGIPS